MSSIAIIGGHGKIALRLAAILTGRGDTVTSIIRNPDHADDIIGTGATPAVADIETLDTDVLAELLGGHDAVVFSAGAGGGNPARTYAVDRDAAIRSVDAARAAGVRRYVMVSYFGAGPGHGVDPGDSFFPYAEAKAAADTYLKASDLDWTILGPSRLTDNPGTSAISVGAGGIETAEVSRDNVAQVIAAVLGNPATVHRVIEFNDGPTPITEALGGEGGRCRRNRPRIVSPRSSAPPPGSPTRAPPPGISPTGPAGGPVSPTPWFVPGPARRSPR